MSVGSAFDAFVKYELAKDLFGQKSPFEFEEIFEDQVEEQNRDWAREAGQHTFDCYCVTGSYDELLADLEKSLEPPRFEFSVQRTVNGVPMLGKPDCRYVDPSGLPVILDWKVCGYCSKSARSPSKHYRMVRDGWDFGKPSRGASQAHKGYMPINHHGMEIHGGYLEYANESYADQISMYGWLMGEEVGDEKVICRIDEICAKPAGDKPFLRVANHIARVSEVHQKSLMNRYAVCWEAIETGLIFDLDPVKNAERVEVLADYYAQLNVEDDFYSSMVRDSV